MHKAGIGQVEALQAIREQRQGDRRRKREAQPGREATQLSCTQDADADAELATGRPRQELKQRDQVGIGCLVHPAASQDVLVAEVAQVRNRAAEAADAKTRSHQKYFPDGSLRACGSRTLFNGYLLLSFLCSHPLTSHGSLRSQSPTSTARYYGENHHIENGWNNSTGFRTDPPGGSVCRQVR